MIKTSELDKATAVSSADLLMLSQLVGEGTFKSLAVTLDILKQFFGDITIVDVGVNLNTLTTPGLYILQGADTMQNSYGLNYPSGLAPGSKVIMMVSQEADPWSMIVQTYFYAKLTSNPCPYSRGKSGSSAWASWTQPVSQTSFDTRAVTQLNMSQGNTELHTVGSGSVSNVWSFIAPDDTTSTPAPKTSPTKKPGIKFNLVNPSARPIIGTYKGNTFIADQDGRVYTNVDTTQVTNIDDPKGVNWRELISVDMKSLKSISKPSTNDSGMSTADALAKVIQVLRDNNILTKDEEAIYTVQPFTDPIEMTTDGGEHSQEVKVLPFYGKAVLYMRSNDTTIAKVAASQQIETLTTESGENGMPVFYGVIQVRINEDESFKPVVGTTTIDFSGSADFATVLASLTVNVTAA